MIDANAEVDWVPAFYGKRMDDWLRNMGDWNISRKRYFGPAAALLPVRCGRLNVVGSRAELDERATVAGWTASRSCTGRGSTMSRFAATAATRRSARIPEVGDAWLDAGIVPFSTLGWQNPESVAGGYATGASRGLSGARPPRPRVLGAVVPGRLDLGEPRADPALVLLAVLHVA